MTDPAAFVHAQTALNAPPLVPEIRLHLATEVTPLWRATEATLASNDVPPPYWAFAWPGGQALARYVLDHPADVAGRRALDFASGSGIVAIAAARAGATVTAADIDDFAAAAIRLNAAANSVAVAVITDDPMGARPSWDMVLAGDVCYEQPMAARATAWLRRLAGEGVTVLLGDPGRSYRPADGLLELARYQVPTSLELEARTVSETVVWRLLPD